MTTKDYFTFTIRHYSDDGDGSIGLRKLGRGRYAFDLWNISLIFEFWGMR